MPSSLDTEGYFYKNKTPVKRSHTSNWFIKKLLFPNKFRKFLKKWDRNQNNFDCFDIIINQFMYYYKPANVILILESLAVLSQIDTLEIIFDSFENFLKYKNS